MTDTDPTVLRLPSIGTAGIHSGSHRPATPVLARPDVISSRLGVVPYPTLPAGQVPPLLHLDSDRDRSSQGMPHLNFTNNNSDIVPKGQPNSEADTQDTVAGQLQTDMFPSGGSPLRQMPERILEALLMYILVSPVLGTHRSPDDAVSRVQPCSHSNAGQRKGQVEVFRDMGCAVDW